MSNFKNILKFENVKKWNVKTQVPKCHNFFDIPKMLKKEKILKNVMMFNDGNQTDFVNGTFTVLSSLEVDKLFESSCKWTASFYSSPLNGASFWRISSSFSLVRGILQEPR